MESVASAPMRTTTRTRRTPRVGPLVWGSVAAVLVVGGLLAFFWFRPGAKPNPLSGQLTATRLSDGKLQPAIVRREWLEGIDADTISAVLKQMEKRTVTLRSDTLVLKFQGVADGIKVTASPGLHADLIAIDVASHKALSNWRQKNGAKLGDRHQRELIRAAKQFIQEWANAEAAGEKKLDFNRFHDSLGIAALTSGLGAEAIAVVGRVPYRCVAEQQGLLYFLLPPATSRFELRGREHSEGHVVFPGQFVVEVQAAAPTTKPESTKPLEDDAETADDAKQNMNSFGKPALNDPAAIDESMPDMPTKKAKPGNEPPKRENKK